MHLQFSLHDHAARDLTFASLLQTADFGPKTALKVVDQIRNKVKQGKLKTGEQIRSELKQQILELLQSVGGGTELRLGDEQPGVILIVGVNGGGKTTTIGKLAHKLNTEGVKVGIHLCCNSDLPAKVSGHLSPCLKHMCSGRHGATLIAMVQRHAAVDFCTFLLQACQNKLLPGTCPVNMLGAQLRDHHKSMQVLLGAGDTFRAAAGEQLQLWAGRSGVDVHSVDREKARPDNVLYQTVDRVRDASCRLIALHCLVHSLRALDCGTVQ